MVARLRGRPMPPQGSAPEPEEPTPGQKGDKTSRFWMVVSICSLLLAIGSSAALFYYVLGPGNQSVLQTENLPAKTTGPVYGMGPFVVNLGNVDERRYLRVAVSLDFQTRDPGFANASAEKQSTWLRHLQDHLKKIDPVLKDVVVTTVSAKTAAALGSAMGKEELKAELISRFNRHMPAETSVQNVYFTDFVIQ